MFNRCLVFVIVSVFALALAAAQVCPPPTGPVHTFSGGSTVSDATTGPWLTGHTYVILGFTSVPSGQTLTIQPGAIVKTGPLGPHVLVVSGLLVANGTAANPIVFTSYRDDASGGDANGDGCATTPAAGDWGSVILGASSSSAIFSRCAFRYGGRTVGFLDVQNSNASITDCTFSDSLTEGIGFHAPAVPVTVANCHFTACRRPISGIPPSAATTVMSNTSSGNTQSDEMWLDGIGTSAGDIAVPTTWSQSSTMNGSGVLVVARPLKVLAGVTFTLAPGMVIKFNNASARIDVLGTLSSNGTAAMPIVFTDVDDDAFGGDTRKDGPTMGSPGDWQAMSFQSNADASTLVHTRVRYAGGSSSAAVILTLADITVMNATIAFSSNHGMSLVASAPVISGTAFVGNTGRPIAQVPITALANLSNNTAMGNGGGDVLSIGGGTLLTTLTLSGSGAFNGTGSYLLASDFGVAAAATLTIDAGVILKCDPTNMPEITIDGTLVSNGTAANPVVFTSLRDDTHGGDTNADGALSMPLPGDWIGLLFTGTADASQLHHVRVRYAGTTTRAGIKLSSCNLSIDDSVIDRCKGPALDAANSLPTLTNSAFDFCGGIAPIVNLPINALQGLSMCTAQGNAGANALRLGSSMLTGMVSLNAASTLNSSGVLVIDGALQVASGASLALAAGMVFKFSSPTLEFNVNGTFTANGTATQPVVFTALADDAFGGDTLGDGQQSVAAGAWRKVRFNLQATPVLNYFAIRFAGQSGATALETDECDPVMDHVVIENCLGAGYVPSGGSMPQATACRFDNCTIPVNAASLAAVTGFTNCTAQGNSMGDTIRIDRHFGSMPLAIGPANSLNGTGVFLITASILGGQPLLLAPGTIFKFMPSVEYSGPIMASGLPGVPVIFTSYRDAIFGGASTGSPSPGASTKGDWKGLTFNDDMTVLSECVIRYAGQGGRAAVVLNMADVTLSRVTIADCLGGAIDFTGTSNPIVTDCLFTGNCQTSFSNLTWAALGNMRDNQTAGGSTTECIVMSNPTVTGHVTINRYCYSGPCIIVTATPNISVAQATITNSLSFGPGVVLKFTAPSLFLRLNQQSRIFGTGGAPVVMTSIHDDSISGDSDMDGSMSVPAPGDWVGLVGHFNVNVPRTPQVEHLVLRYAGAMNPAGTAPQNAGFQGLVSVMNSVRVDRCLGFGLYIGPGTYSNLVAFANTGTGISGGNIPCFDPNPQNCLTGATFYHSTSVMNGGDGFYALGAPPQPGSFLPSLFANACIAWANGGTNYIGAAGSVTRWCDGSTAGPCPPTGTLGCFVYGNDNIDVDPLFVNLANGDLRLMPSSPCVDRYPASPSITPSATRDFTEASRMIPHAAAVGAPALSDLGAYEISPVGLGAIGDARVGMTFSLVASAAPGNVALVVGLQDGIRLYPGIGFLMAGAPETVLALGVVPVGTPLLIPIPPIPFLDGFEFACQALAAPYVAPVAGVFSNLLRIRIRG